MSTLGTYFQNFRNNTKGTEPPHTTPNDWSEFKALTDVDLNNFDLVNASSITANQFIGGVDLTGDLEVEQDLYIKKDISGGTRITTALNNAYYQNFNNGQMVFSPYFSSDEILTIDPSNNFIRVNNEAYLGNKSQTTEQQPLRVINATGSRSNDNNPVSIGFYNAISNFVGNEENAKILLRDENGANNTADGVLETWLRTDPNADGTSSYLMKGYSITANRGELEHFLDTNLTISNTLTVEGTINPLSDISFTGTGPIRLLSTNIGAAYLNFDTGGTGSKLTLGTGNFLFNTTSPFSQEITATGGIDLTFGANSSSRYYERTSSGTTDLNLKFYNPISVEDSTAYPVEHEILIYNNSVVGDLDLNFSILDSSGSPSAAFDFIYMTPTTKGKASSFTFTISPSGTLSNKLYHVKVKALGDSTKDVKYFVQIS